MLQLVAGVCVEERMPVPRMVGGVAVRHSAYERKASISIISLVGPGD